MMRQLLLVAFICLVFGLGAYRGTGELGLFGGANLVVGALALVAAVAVSFRRGRQTGTPWGPLADALLMAVAVIWGALLVEGFARASEVRFDWTSERSFELAPATIEAVERMPQPVTATLYADDLDPRARRTLLLLRQLEPYGDVTVRRRALEAYPEDEDRYGIRSSNSVIFTMGPTANPNWERVDRPTEGAIFEALSYLSHGLDQKPVIYLSSGAGEGDVSATTPLGYSGIAAALETEGFEMRLLSSPSLDRIPSDADGVMILGPERGLHPTMLRALRHYLENGGSLVALLEPGIESGVEALLAEFGLLAQDGVVIDPLAGAIDGETPGLSPIVSNYAGHPITKGLQATRQTFFRGARSFDLYKAEQTDDLKGVAFSSANAWIAPDASAVTGSRTPLPPPDARPGYQPLVVAGRYDRGGTETRIVAFGDRDFAANRDLRSLYNLDLLVNATHWALRRENAITIRPKAGGVLQFPVPIQNSLKAFYGVGLLVPQILLLTGGWIWLRRRGA